MDSTIAPGKLTFEYDRIGDILYVNKCAVYPEQESAEIASGIVARLNLPIAVDGCLAIAA